jgi:membrane protein
MSALILIYGLVTDPAVIERQVAALSDVLPGEALKLVSDQLHNLVAAPSGKLGVGLLVSLALALWSATSGMGTLMQALTIAYEEKNDRGLIAFYVRALALTIAIGIFGLISLFLIAVVPAVIDWLPIPPVLRTTVALIRWPMLAGLVFLALALVYRFAPARQIPCWDWLSPGTVAAALLWLIGSAGFSFYVARFSSYDKTYGSLGAVVVLLMWLYVSAYIVLAGAELNSAIEKARRR